MIYLCKDCESHLVLFAKQISHIELFNYKTLSSLLSCFIGFEVTGKKEEYCIGLKVIHPCRNIYSTYNKSGFDNVDKCERVKMDCSNIILSILFLFI